VFAEHHNSKTRPQHTCRDYSKMSQANNGRAPMSSRKFVLVLLSEEGKTMHLVQTRVSQKGQVTIPLEVRRRLGIKVGDRVTFEIQEGNVAVLRRSSWLDDFAGSVPHPDPPLTIEQERRAFEEGVGAEAAARGR
jgi:AbrB family looped-hinge helix DNA binding protein